jgi:signal peptidase II
MHRLKRIALIAALLVFCVGCDQTTKSLARDHLQTRPAITFLGDTLRLQYAENPGAFLSLGATLPHEWATAVFTLGGSVVILAALLYAVLAAKLGARELVALCLVCGGGIGNLIDRVRFHGYVTDFLNMGLGSIRTGIFNVADVALMVGLVLFAFRYARSDQREI